MSPGVVSHLAATVGLLGLLPVLSVPAQNRPSYRPPKPGGIPQTGFPAGGAKNTVSPPNRHGNPASFWTGYPSLFDMSGYTGGNFSVTPIVPFPSYDPNAVLQPGYRYNAHFDRYLNGEPTSYNRFNYQNGLSGRGYPFYYDRATGFFPNGYAAFPAYAPAIIIGQSVPGPYIYQGGTFPGAIGAGVVFVTPPSFAALPVPVYSNAGQFQQWQNAGREVSPTEAAQNTVNRAAAALRTAWRSRDSSLLARYLAPQSRIAVYREGRYLYSLKAADFLDITRDTFRAVRTVAFQISTPQPIRPGVFMATARHTYEDGGGSERTSFLGYVLEARNGRFVLTQFTSAPEWRME